MGRSESDEKQQCLTCNGCSGFLVFKRVISSRKVAAHSFLHFKSSSCKTFHTHSGFLDLSQLSRASLLKAAVAALLLLLRWMFAMVSEFLTTSMSPILFPVDRQPYGIILRVVTEHYNRLV